MKNKKVIRIGYYLGLVIFAIGFILRIILANDLAVTVCFIGALVLFLTGMYSYFMDKRIKK